MSGPNAKKLLHCAIYTRKSTDHNLDLEFNSLDAQREACQAFKEIVTLKIPARLQRAGRELRMVVQNSDNQRPPDPSLLRILARAHDIQARLTQSPDLSVHDIARAEKLTAAYIYSVLRLPWLAPDITAAIVNGRSPPQLTAKRLMRLSAHLPVDWAEQRKLLGFR